MSEKKLKSVNIWQSYKQKRDCLVHFASLANSPLNMKKVHETITFLLVNLPNIHRFKNIFTRRLSNKPFLIWLLTSPPHLKYVAALSCNLLLMGCFGDISVSEGSVATYARCGGTFNILLTANLPGNHPVNFLNRLRFDRIMVMSLWPPFWPTMYITHIGILY